MVSYNVILAELKQAVEAKPDLADVIGLHAALIARQAQSDTEACVVLDTAPVRTGPECSVLLPADSVVVDANALTDLALDMADITAHKRPDLAQVLLTIRAWLAEQRGRMTSLAQEFLRHNRLPEAEQAGLDSGLVAFVMNNALHPFLRAQAERLAPQIDEPTWYRGVCPICGGEPDFAALGKESGARRLLCSRCDTEWAFWRTACPFCGNEEGVSYYETQPPYRLYVCNACRRYLKTIDLRQVSGERFLPVERILTIEMDVAAQGAGWKGP